MLVKNFFLLKVNKQLSIANFHFISIQFCKFESHYGDNRFSCWLFRAIYYPSFFFFFIFNRNERNCTIWSYANRFYYCKRSKTHRTWQPCCAMLVQSAITVLISVATKYSRSRIDVWQRITRIVAFVVIIYSCSFFINLNFFQLVWNFIFLYFFFFPPNWNDNLQKTSLFCPVKVKRTQKLDIQAFIFLLL